MKGGGTDFICDSSSLISLTDTCFLPAISTICSSFDGSFLIPKSVEAESVTTPVKNKAYALNALRIKHAIDRGILKVSPFDASMHASQIMEIANNVFFLSGKPMPLLHQGESEILALCDALGINNVLIDERTTRMLIESPLLLKDHLAKEFKKNIGTNEENLGKFQKLTSSLNLFRSSELLILAYEKGYFSSLGALELDTLEAGLYSLKYSGCAISFEEIVTFVESVRESG
ncbi:hypothetical protein FJZ26_05840 [Candidatus Parvarchaeota archaeon]|nr:hypothetical protein [Candidatus Parvarchaeota archaeon]